MELLGASNLAFFNSCDDDTPLLRLATEASILVTNESLHECEHI